MTSNNDFYAPPREKVPATAPYVIERATGVVHPNTEFFADRLDLVAPCYNLQGSADPKDYDGVYNPRMYVVDSTARLPASAAAPLTIADAMATVCTVTRERDELLGELRKLREIVEGRAQANATKEADSTESAAASEGDVKAEGNTSSKSKRKA